MQTFFRVSPFSFLPLIAVVPGCHVLPVLVVPNFHRLCGVHSEHLHNATIAGKQTGTTRLTYCANHYAVTGAAVNDATDPQLEAAILTAGADMGLQLTPQQVERMLQLQLACEQRIGVIIMGPSGSGKSTLWQVRRALSLFTLNL